MDGVWNEYFRYVSQWKRAEDRERLGLAELYQIGMRTRETDPESSYAAFARGRDEARRLKEPWWELFFEDWRLIIMTADVKDFTRALPLALELMVRYGAADAPYAPLRNSVLRNILDTYTQIDPLGYRDEIERGFAYLDGQVSPDPVESRFVLEYARVDYLMATENWNGAFDRALRYLGLVDRSREDRLKIWFGAWANYELCRICHALGRADDLVDHADSMLELSKKDSHLRRTEADAWIWRAVSQRRRGEGKNASRSFHEGMRLLGGLGKRDAICADPLVAYHEACGDLRAAVGVCDRELAEVAENGQLHRVCQIGIERCRLLAGIGELTSADLESARFSAGKLRTPEPFLQKLYLIETADRTMP